MTQINDPKLLPCPFCGEDAALWYYPANKRKCKDSYYVGCTNDNCGCEMERSGGWKTYEDAVIAWNHRSSHSENPTGSTTKNDLGVDCISRDDVWDVMQELWGTSGELIDRLMSLPSVTPQEPKTGHCKDCKWWKDKDGVYRRGIAAESKCPINRREVMEGRGYCFLFEPQESEDR